MNFSQVHSDIHSRNMKVHFFQKWTSFLVQYETLNIQWVCLPRDNKVIIWVQIPELFSYDSNYEYLTFGSFKKYVRTNSTEKKIRIFEKTWIFEKKIFGTFWVHILILRQHDVYYPSVHKLENIFHTLFVFQQQIL